MITFNTIKIRTLFHNGNGWLGYLRFSDKKSSLNKIYDFPNLLLILVNDYQPNTLTHLYEYLDEDFCLFSNFPHEKLVYPLIQPGKNALINCSCTLLYLIKNHNLYFYIDKIINEIYPDGVDDLANVYCKHKLLEHKCDFSSRLSKCNKSNFNLITDYSFDLTLNVNLELIFNLLEYIIIVILNPGLSFFGILTNLLVMLIVNNIKNLKKAKINETKKAKDSMFNHIFAHSGFNVLFCIITILKLINECTTSELFCSSVFNSSAAQWFDTYMCTRHFSGL